MANRAKSKTLHYLLPTDLRVKIYKSAYWKEHCVDLTILTVIDKAEELDYIGGAYDDDVDPSPFMCLLLRMLMIEPKKEVVIEIIEITTNKYVCALAALCLRLTGWDVDVYRCLELLYNNKQDLRLKQQDGSQLSLQSIMSNLKL